MRVEFKQDSLPPQASGNPFLLLRFSTMEVGWKFLIQPYNPGRGSSIQPIGTTGDDC